MNKTILVIIIAIVVLGLGGIVLANQKSPNNNQNLLSYFWNHSKSHRCQIINQEYKTETKIEYNTDCVQQICEQKHAGNSVEVQQCLNLAGLSGLLSYYTFGECESQVDEFQVPLHDEYNGKQWRDYYLGIPVLKESCPDGYSVQ